MGCPYNANDCYCDEAPDDDSLSSGKWRKQGQPEDNLSGLAARESAATRVEPAPIHNSNPAAWDLVITDMKARDQFGAAKYGTRLQPNNGRDALADAYQEALDLCVYLRQAIYERDGK